MGYFSNGTEGDMYKEKWCNRCIHCPDDEADCAILAVHSGYNYEQNQPGMSRVNHILGMLIPVVKLGNKPENFDLRPDITLETNGECFMFHVKQEIGPRHLPACRYYGDEREPDASCANSGGACAVPR